MNIYSADISAFLLNNFVQLETGVNIIQTDSLAVNGSCIALSGVFPEPSDYIQKTYNDGPLTCEAIKEIASLKVADFLDIEFCQRLYGDLIESSLKIGAQTLIIDAAPASFCY